MTVLFQDYFDGTLSNWSDLNGVVQKSISNSHMNVTCPAGVSGTGVFCNFSNTGNTHEVSLVMRFDATYTTGDYKRVDLAIADTQYPWSGNSPCGLSVLQGASGISISASIPGSSPQLITIDPSLIVGRFFRYFITYTKSTGNCKIDVYDDLGSLVTSTTLKTNYVSSQSLWNFKVVSISTGSTPNTAIVDNVIIQTASDVFYCDPTTVNFTYAPTPVKVGIPTQFTDTSTGTPGSSWAWNFGDGVTSTIQNPMHTFTSKTSSRTVSLTITNTCGGIHSKSNTFEVLDPDPQELQLLGFMGNGPSFDIVEVGGVMFAAQGCIVRTYDVSSKDYVPEITFRDFTYEFTVGSEVRSLWVDGNTVYVLGTHKLVLIDASDPSVPQIIGYFDKPVTHGIYRDIEVHNGLAYISCYDVGLVILNVSNPTAISFVSQTTLGGYNRPWRLTYRNGYVYVGSEGYPRLDIINVSNPNTPTITGTYEYPMGGYTSFSSVAVGDNYAYVCIYHNGLIAIDISNKSLPTLVFTDLLPDPIGDADPDLYNYNDVKIVNNYYLFVSVRYVGIKMYHLGTPNQPTYIPFICNEPMRGYSEGVYVSTNDAGIPDMAFLANESRGISVFDVSPTFDGIEPGEPRHLLYLPTVNGCDSLYLDGDHLYIGGHNDCIWSVDISQPSRPVDVSYAGGTGRNWALDTYGEQIYSASAWKGICIVDKSYPDDIWLINSDIYNDGYDNIWNILIDGHYIYTSDGILDLEDSTNPIYIFKNYPSGVYSDGTPIQPPTMQTLFVGKYIKIPGTQYVLCASYVGFVGCRVIDVTSKYNPIIKTTLFDGIQCSCVGISNGNLVLGTMDGKIQVYDITNIMAPVLLSQLTFTGEWYPRSMSIPNNGSLIYTCGGGTGSLLKVFDTTDVNNLKYVAKATPIKEDWLSIVSDDRYVVIGSKFGAFVYASRPVPLIVSSLVCTPTVTRTGATVEATATIINQSSGEITTTIQWFVNSNAHGDPITITIQPFETQTHTTTFIAEETCSVCLHY